MKSLKMIKKQAQAGFTLIELMIVVAIIGVLAAVAIPAYSEYTLKAKIGAALSSVDSVKTAIGLCVQEAGGDNTNCGVGTSGSPVKPFAPTKEVKSVSFTTGATPALVLTLNKLGNGAPDDATITMTACGLDGSKANVTWLNTSTVTGAALVAVQKNNPPACVTAAASS